MELLILIYACKTSYARSITVILPYLPYSKQCRVRRRSAIPMKLVADMICRAGVTRLVPLDLYSCSDSCTHHSREIRSSMTQMM
uniref:Ribose-phosphate pyrophosphokinase N-terminal domain-containing protein n=1 Tax=Parascaris univalens TaxID=6257 RepID=A0A915A1R7_PARUN